MRIARQLLFGALCAAAACNSRQVISQDGAADAARRDGRALDGRSDGAPLADGGPRDARGSDAGCACPGDQVRYHGTCVPTRLRDECTTRCDPEAAASCGAEQRCDRWAAVTPDPSCAITAAALPACVPRRPAQTGDLRISPTSGGAGNLASLTIEGGELTIGALMWLARIGDGQAAEVGPPGGGACRHEAALMPPRPGIFPVEVWYGTPGAAPNSPLLAGFYVASGGVIPEPMAQPGERCSAALPCAQAAPYSCSCTAGRCACSR